ncbi:hypothetical protein OKW76_00395 [Sphingomonas sp. S1-29]|uniref:hypothetical protein n=1 Tax=Sphingomonas sp. S1-29 TaxID=2991074 RepID=UPI0022405E15|nr:hypothetical protein [Sphingomonas sp. S1-29]UZK69584.1 hypothetical protein OKW76_00395 [Sphingomonas sp. S1-29]
MISKDFRYHILSLSKTRQDALIQQLPADFEVNIASDDDSQTVCIGIPNDIDGRVYLRFLVYGEGIDGAINTFQQLHEGEVFLIKNAPKGCAAYVHHTYSQYLEWKEYQRNPSPGEEDGYPEGVVSDLTKDIKDQLSEYDEDIAFYFMMKYM